MADISKTKDDLAVTALTLPPSTRDIKIDKIYHQCSAFGRVDNVQIATFGGCRTKLSIEQKSLANDSTVIGKNPLSPNDCSDWSRILNLKGTWCTKTLESLRLYNCDIPADLAKKLRPLFDDLQKLEVTDCIIESDDELFSNYESLVELKVAGEDIGEMAFIFKHTFPKLSRLDCNDYIHGYGLKEFISRHMNLSILTISNCRALFLPIIAKNCKKLQELHIQSHVGDTNEYEEALTSLLSLRNLKKLKIESDIRNVTKFTKMLHSLNSLEVLVFEDVRVDSEFISTVSQLKQLKVLRLLGCFGLNHLNKLGLLYKLTELSISSSEGVDVDIVRMLKRLYNLKNLHLDVESFKVDKKIYLKLVDVVRSRPKRCNEFLEITCHIDHDAIFDEKRMNIVKVNGIGTWDSKESLDFNNFFQEETINI